MRKELEETCKTLIAEHKYKECESVIERAMGQFPHSPVPHNLMGILSEVQHNHVLALKHFRAAYALDPTYIPARYNLDLYASMHPEGQCAYTEEECTMTQDAHFKMVYDEHRVGHLVRK